MPDKSKSLNEVALTLAYWLTAVRLLLWAAPISVDGSGMVGTLYWTGPTSLATSSEFAASVCVRFAFLAPYLATALAITVVGRVTTPILARLVAGDFLGAFSICAGQLLSITLLIDVGSQAGLWVLPKSSFLTNPSPIQLVLLAMSALAGALTRFEFPGGSTYLLLVAGLVLDFGVFLQVLQGAAGYSGLPETIVAAGLTAIALGRNRKRNLTGHNTDGA